MMARREFEEMEKRLDGYIKKAERGERPLESELRDVIGMVTSVFGNAIDALNTENECDAFDDALTCGLNTVADMTRELRLQYFKTISVTADTPEDIERHKEELEKRKHKANSAIVDYLVVRTRLEAGGHSCQ